jgi:Domain of unknown function (DUF4136)
MSRYITRANACHHMSDRSFMKNFRLNSRPIILLWFTCFSFLAGCSTTQPQKIESGSELSKGVKLAGLTTFRFLPNRVMAQAEAVSNTPYWYSQIGIAVAKNLSAKGYRQVGNGKSDFLVAYHVVLKRAGQTVTTISNYSEYDLSPSQHAKTSLSKFNGPKAPGEGPIGFVIIDFLDPASRQLLWRGWAKTSLTGGQDPNRLTQIISAAVDRILETLPAKSGG